MSSYPSIQRSDAVEPLEPEPFQNAVSALGDDIVRLSQGKEIRNEELLALYGSLPKRTEGPPVIARVGRRFQPSPFAGHALLARRGDFHLAHPSGRRSMVRA